MFAAAAHAFDRVEIGLGDMQGDGWQARAVTLYIDLSSASEPSGEITIGELQLPAPLGSLGAVRARCDTLVHDARGTRCNGRVELAQLLGEPANAALRIEHHAADGGVRMALQDVRLAAGTWHADVLAAHGRWEVSATGTQVDSAALQEMLRPLLPASDYNFGGAVDVKTRIAGSGVAVDSVHMELASDGLGFSNAGGTQASERLALDAAAQLRRSDDGWSGDAHATMSGGALFIDPLYLEPNAASAIRLGARLHWSAAQQRLAVDDLTLHHAGVARIDGTLQVHIADAVRVEAADLELREAHLPAAYSSYIQPWLHGTAGAALETAGTISGHVRYAADGAKELHLTLDDVHIDDAAQRFAVHALSGVVNWGSDPTVRTTELRWRSGTLFRLAVGAAGLAVQSRGTQFEIREPMRIPVLDGSLLIDTLTLADPGGAGLKWSFDGVLTPVSMEAVCAALDWPRFGGTLSGVIPAVSYADGVLEVGGTLLARAFDGDVTVRSLRLEQPFGRVPRLRADVGIERLDLNMLTSTFAFGKIEGRLSGRVAGLEMVDWQPVAFDAGFATPADDRSRHRISQQAVDNLASIGGGMRGVLSRSFLGVLDEFPYESLGLSCVLDNGVCHMRGVAPADNGYYIVKGRFLPPRIDVVGYADRVDWQTLIERLRSVTLEQAPIVR